MSNNIKEFESNLSQLEACVKQLEQPEQQNLASLLNCYQKGLEKAKACDLALKETDQKIQKCTRYAHTLESLRAGWDALWIRIGTRGSYRANLGSIAPVECGNNPYVGCISRAGRY